MVEGGLREGFLEKEVLWKGRISMSGCLPEDRSR